MTTHGAGRRVVGERRWRLGSERKVTRISLRQNGTYRRIRGVVDKIRYGQYLWDSGHWAAASAPSELFDEQHSYLIVELSGARDG